MFVKDLEIGVLLDFYGNVLPEDQREILSGYYFEDLSLAEIAESSGMTRQGVRAAIKRGEKQLHFLEETLGLCGEYRKRQQMLDGVCVTLRRLADEAETSGRSGEASELRAAAALAEEAVSMQK